MSLTSSKRSGVPIMNDCEISRRLSIRTMCFGAMCALEVRAGNRLDTICVELIEAGEKVCCEYCVIMPRVPSYLHLRQCDTTYQRRHCDLGVVV